MAHVTTFTKTENASTTTSVLTVGSAVATGRTLVGALCWDSAAGVVPTISSITDSRGNTWTTTPDAGVDAGTTLAVAIIRARVTTALQAGDTVTVTLSLARARWAWQVDVFDDVNTSPLDVTATNAPASSASLSTGSTAATAQAYELTYAAFGFGSGRTATIPAGWSGGSLVATSAGSSDRILQATWQYTSSAGAQQGTLTISPASTYAAAVATYTATSLSPPVAQVSQVKLTVPQPSSVAVAQVSQVKLTVPQASMGVAHIAQVKLRVPTAAGQAPYSGLKALTEDGNYTDGTLSPVQGT